jgi:hypothetical protein
MTRSLKFAYLDIGIPKTERLSSIQFPNSKFKEALALRWLLWPEKWRTLSCLSHMSTWDRG